MGKLVDTIGETGFFKDGHADAAVGCADASLRGFA